MNESQIPRLSRPFRRELKRLTRDFYVLYILMLKNHLHSTAYISLMHFCIRGLHLLFILYRKNKYLDSLSETWTEVYVVCSIEIEFFLYLGVLFVFRIFGNYIV